MYFFSPLNLNVDTEFALIQMMVLKFFKNAEFNYPDVPGKHQQNKFSQQRAFGAYELPWTCILLASVLSTNKEINADFL